MSDNDRSTKVLLLNDDQTTMEFVVQVLEVIFGKTSDEAIKLMLAIYRDGSGECGVYTPELTSKIAEQVARAELDRMAILSAASSKQGQTPDANGPAPQFGSAPWRWQ